MSNPRLRDLSRKRLLALGIPEDEHTLEGVSRLFPPLFRPEVPHLDLDSLAALLLYFVDHHLISPPRRSAVEQAADLGSGVHFCQFYRTHADLIEMIVPYFQQGLEQGEYCIWVLPSPLTPETGVAALKAADRRFSGPLLRREMEILGWEDCYLLASGRMRPVEEIIEGFVEKAREVVERGFRGMCVSGDKSWFSVAGSLGEFGELERQISQACRNARIKALCTYPFQACSEEHWPTILETHDEAFLKEGIFWHRIRNAYLGRSKIASMLREFA